MREKKKNTGRTLKKSRNKSLSLMQQNRIVAKYRNYELWNILIVIKYISYLDRDVTIL